MRVPGAQRGSMSTADPEDVTGPNASGSPNVVLRARNLHVMFGGQAVLNGVNLEVRAGEIILIRGENGSGKTTLINILTGNLKPNKGRIEYSDASRWATYRFGGLHGPPPLPFVPEVIASKGIGRVWQDTRLFKSLSLLENVLVGQPANPGENPASLFLTPGRVRAAEASGVGHALGVLERLGLDASRDAAGDAVSLGQSKRVGIARAMEADAAVLFLDEPLAGLDRDGIGQVMGLLLELVRSRSVALVIVEHVFNHMHLDNVVTTNWKLDRGKLTVSGGGIQQQTDSSSVAAPWVSQFGRDAIVQEEELGRGATLIHYKPRSPRRGETVLLDVRKLSVRRGRQSVLGSDQQGLSFTIGPGEVALLQAPNGWGKSTLLETIAGVIPSHSGSISLLGVDLTKLSAWRRRRDGLQFLPASLNIIEDLSVRQHLAVAGAEPSAISMLPPFLRDKRVGNLSGGQKQLLALISTITSRAATMRLFDEPLSMLDQPGIEQALGILAPRDDTSVLIAMPSPRAAQ